MTALSPAEFHATVEVAARAFLPGAELALEPLGHGDALCYRVESARGRHLLRVHAPRAGRADPAFTEPAAIESECAWLRALAAETRLEVQVPVPSPEGGGHVLLVAAQDHAAPLPCTLLTWLEGEPASGRPTAEGAAQLGELLATLHEHARSWRPPPGFTRPRHEPASWRAALARVLELEELSAPRRALLSDVVATCESELTPLARDEARRGLIHADLHPGNVLFHGGAVRPIDFGRCGEGPWLYDVAECAIGLAPPLRRSLLDAYGARAPLEPADLRRIEGYAAAALIEVFGRCAGDPEERDYLTRALPAWTPHLERFVAGAPFLLAL